MVVKRTDYTAEAVEAARSVLLELTHLLGEYRDGIVIVGGWVPELLFSKPGQRHIGSLDVDVALDHQMLQEAGYKTIMQLLLSRGYRQGKQPYIFFRTVQIERRDIEVEVDFLAGEYAGTTRGHRTQRVQDTQPRKARGCDLPAGCLLASSLFHQILVHLMGIVGPQPMHATDLDPRLAHGLEEECLKILGRNETSCPAIPASNKHIESRPAPTHGYIVVQVPAGYPVM